MSCSPRGRDLRVRLQSVRRETCSKSKAIFTDHKYPREVSAPGRVVLDISFTSFEILIHADRNVESERAPTESKAHAGIYEDRISRSTEAAAPTDQVVDRYAIDAGTDAERKPLLRPDREGNSSPEGIDVRHG